MLGLLGKLLLIVIQNMHVMQCAVEMLLLSHVLSLIQSRLVIKVLQVHIIYIFNGILTSSLSGDWHG